MEVPVKVLKSVALCTLPLALMVAVVGAQEVELTSSCEKRISGSDEDLIREAYYLAYDLRKIAWEEIEDDAERKDGGKYENQDHVGYAYVTDKNREKWLDQMEKVKITCEGDICGSGKWYGHAGVAAWGPIPGNKIRVCVNHTRDKVNEKQPDREIWGTSTYTRKHAALVSSLAGTIAHEVMHLADPSTDDEREADAIDHAIQNVICSPDLVPSIRDVVISWHDGYEILCYIDVENRNDYTGPEDTVPLYGEGRNRSFYVETRLGDDNEIRDVIYGINGGGYGEAWPKFTIPADADLDEWTFDLEVTVDPDNYVWEHSEDNNAAHRSVSLRSDLSIERVDLTGPYTEKEAAKHRGWRTLEYEVLVRNVHESMVARPTTLALYHTDIWSPMDKLAKQEQDVPAMEPGDWKRYYFQVDVPLEGEFAALNEEGKFILDFVLDEDEWVGDSDRTNNRWEFKIDDDYFRPDYLVDILDDPAFDDGRVEMQCIGWNEGPVEGTTTCAAVMSIWIDGEAGYSPDEVTIRDLEVSELIPFDVQQDHELIVGRVMYLVEIDKHDDIKENKYILNGEERDGENNNYALVQLGVDLAMLEKILELGVIAGEFVGVDRPYDLQEAVDASRFKLFMNPDAWIINVIDPGVIVGPTFPEGPYELEAVRGALNEGMGKDLPIGEFMRVLSERTTSGDEVDLINNMAPAVIYNQKSTRLLFVRLP
jgi:hypothetical protein